MLEQQKIEWKSSWRDEYLKWVCGFANANGGTLYIGKDDSGRVVGIDNYKRLLEELPNKIKDVLGVFAEVNLHKQDAIFFLEIVVPRYDVPISLRGKYYLRSGSTLQELTGISLNEFILKRTGKTWDDIPEERATMEDISVITVKRFLKDAKISNRINVEDSLSVEQLLGKLRLIENGQLKRAAIILFGKDPGRFYNNLTVKIGKFGDSDDHIIFHEVLEDNLIELQRKLVEMLHAKFFIHPIKFEGMQRIEQDEYPEAAVREMILNALVHRNYMGAPTQIRLYKDSFSVWNHGGLPEKISVDDLWKTHRSIPRNPLVADVCFKGGYIDIWGSGTLRIVSACNTAGLPKPIMVEEQGGFLCKLMKDINVVAEKERLNLNERQIKALVYVEKKGVITNKEYRELNGIGKTVATKELVEMVSLGVLHPAKARGRGAKYLLKRIGR